MSEDTQMNRRDFLKTLGGVGVATAALSVGCAHKNEVKSEGVTIGEVPTDKMTYRKNSHGEKVSLLGYGMMRLPMVNDVNVREEDAEIDQELVNKEVDYALAHGLTYIDTAPVYCKGLCERAVGIALSRHKRSEYTIATKMSNFDNTDRESSIKMYHNSFKELRVDYFDYYLMHSVGETGWDMVDERFFRNGMLDFLMEERKAGRIRNLGFSFHGDVKVFDRLLSMHDKVHWDFVQIQMNYVDWNHPTPYNVAASYLYSELEKRNIPVVVMEPLLGGRLADLPTHFVEELKGRCPENSVASWAFRFVGSHPGIMVMLSGMTYMEHLQDNLKTVSPLKPLNQEEFDLLEKIASEYSEYPLVPCTGCQYCMPCPYGLDIPGIFKHYNKCVNEGDVIEESDITSNEYRKARRAFLVGYDRSVPKLRQADHCIGCGKCMERCPQQINIPEEMIRINNYVEKLKKV